MIKGIGTDIVDIARIGKSLENKRFMDMVFTENEQRLLKKKESFAGNFSAKEAVVKAIGTGFDGFFPNCVEILRDENSKPFVRLYGKAKKNAERLGIDIIHISIAHERDKAIAFATAEGI